jgi:TIR domain
VIDFATKLRAERGLDAFVDSWEIRPGDSLTQWIFDEGIGRAVAVIVVISEYRINKSWVRKELDVSTVMQIEDYLKLIPVVIGDIENSDADKPERYAVGTSRRPRRVRCRVE